MSFFRSGPVFALVSLFIITMQPVSAQDMPTAAEMEQYQQMMEQMVNDPAFQEQMRQMQER